MRSNDWPGERWLGMCWNAIDRSFDKAGLGAGQIFGGWPGYSGISRGRANAAVETWSYAFSDSLRDGNLLPAS
ncbi:hypothetical protein N7468_009694 [Penicillium chermesinum]|uniref:Uncharacterized protein n=1 Tax=Penicillium chermesinum TaxID=63820 RepID=A0A9W9TGD2_9EURO|nr:uncharacterized protein N7468_009694 [Penicillium chermesinum]KAJ5220490.1 hypothetical protein N7468_009694 [Penicillium chermesinum]